MVLIDIKKLIRKRMQEINSSYEKDPGYEMCKNFVQNNNVTGVESFVNIDVYECIKCLFYIENTTGKTPDECSIFIDSIKDYVDEMNYQDFTDLFDLLFALSGSRQVDRITEYLKEESSERAVHLLESINFKELHSISTADMSDWEKTRALKKILMGLRSLQDKCNVADIIEYASEDNETLGSILALIEVQKKMAEDRERLELSMDLLSYSTRKKDRDKLVNAYYKDYYKPKAILGAVNSIKTFVNENEKEEEKYYKRVQREFHGYETSISMLEEALGKKEITNSRAIIKNVADEKIKKAILELIYEHNMKYYSTLEESYNKHSQNSVSAYISILSKHNIYISDDTCKRLMINPIEDFKEIVDIVSKFGLSQEQMIRVLSRTNHNVSRKIKEYTDKGYLLPGFICENLDLFDEQTSSYNSLVSNVSVLDTYNINPLLFANTPEALLLDNEFFKNNFSIIDSYGLLKSLKTTTNFNFISYSDLASKIDSFIELGLFALLEQDLNLLNSNNIKRLYVLKAMNFELSDIDINKIKETLNSSRFIINDSMLDDYIPNILPYKNKTPFDFGVDELENFRTDKNTYKIGGVLISSNKVKRLLESGLDLYDAIFDGVLISDDEYNIIINTLSFKK